MAEDAAAAPVEIEQPGDQPPAEQPIAEQPAAEDAGAAPTEEAAAAEGASKRSREEDAGADGEEPEAKRAAAAGIEGQLNVRTLVLNDLLARRQAQFHQPTHVSFCLLLWSGAGPRWCS